MKKGKNLIVVLLVVLMLFTACGDKTTSEEPISQPPVANDNNLKKGEVGEAMLDHFKENKEIQVAIKLNAFMLDGHEELRFIPDLVGNEPNSNMSLEVFMPKYDMVGIGAVGFVYVNAGDISRLKTDSDFLAEKMMESDDLLYALNSDSYANKVKGFTISSQKAKAVLNIKEIAAQAIRDGKVEIQ